jgi:hypothetical protein
MFIINVHNQKHCILHSKPTEFALADHVSLAFCKVENAIDWTAATTSYAASVRRIARTRCLARTALYRYQTANFVSGLCNLLEVHWLVYIDCSIVFFLQAVDSNTWNWNPDV